MTTMFTPEELARCNRMAKRAASGASHGFIYGGNPANLNLGWDTFRPKPSIHLAPKPPMTFGRSIGSMGHGLASQAGNYTQALFTGHHGQPSLLGNLAFGAVDTLRGRSPGWGFRSGKVWAPLREAMPEMREAWQQTSEPAAYATNKAMDAYHWLRHQLIDPREYGRM